MLTWCLDGTCERNGIEFRCQCHEDSANLFLKDTLKALKEKKPAAPEPEPEPTTEVLFLCSYEGCGKTFIDAGALRKHSHIHGERQFVCHYEGCGKCKREYHVGCLKDHNMQNLEVYQFCRVWT